MTGTVLAELALTVLVYARTRSSLLSALVFTTEFLPYLVSGALFAAMVDRMPTRRLLAGCNLLSCALALLMALPTTPVAALLVLAFALGLIRPVFLGARAATLPDVLPGGAYVPGRSLLRIISQAAQVGGFAVSGMLLTVISPRTLLLSNAICFALAAAVLRFGTRERAPAGKAGQMPQRSLVRDSLSGIREVFSVPPVRRIVLFGWAVPALAVMPEALVVPYVASLSGGTASVGVLLTAVPLGTMTGEMLGNWLVPPARQARAAPAFAALTFVPLLLFALHPAVPVALAALFVSGLGGAAHLGLDRLLLQATPEGLLARTLTLQASGLMFWQGIGYAAAGAAAEVLPATAVITIAGVTGLAAAAWYAIAAPVADSRPATIG